MALAAIRDSQKATKKLKGCCHEKHDDYETGGSDVCCGLPWNGICRTNEEKTLTVTVEENEGCANGISVSDQSWGDRHLCADTPNVAAGYLRPYVGQAVEIERSGRSPLIPRPTRPIP